MRGGQLHIGQDYPFLIRFFDLGTKEGFKLKILLRMRLKRPEGVGAEIKREKEQRYREINRDE